MPIIESGSSLRNKFLKLESAIERSSKSCDDHTFSQKNLQSSREALKILGVGINTTPPEQEKSDVEFRRAC